MTAETYVKQIVKKVKCSRKKREEIRRQLLADINLEVEQGEALDKVILRMGEPISIADEFNQMVEHRYLNEFPAKRDVLPFLEKLRSLGIPMCVATATDRYLAEAALKRLDMFQYFRFILTCTEVGHNKNEPVIFEKACSGLQVPKEHVIIFEDSLHAIQTAKNAGFYTVAIQEDSVSADEPKIKQLADQFVHNFAEVIL